MIAMATYSFRIYVVANRPSSRVALANLRALCDEVVPGDYELEVVDVLHEPDRAEVARIMVTPTVVKLAPLPRRRVIGDLSDRDEAAIALDLSYIGHGTDQGGPP